jgi:hypothetical protein
LPAGNNPQPSAEQDRPSLDLGKLGRVIAMVGSASDGEALNAARTADRILRSAGVPWLDFVEAYRRAEVATEAASVLLAENAALRAEVDQLRSTGAAVAVWTDLGAQVSDTRKAAEWALDIHRRGLVWLSDFEIPFLQRCTRWTGRLTPKMQPVFQRVLDRVVERTGLTPP